MLDSKTFDPLAKLLEENCEVKDLLQAVLNNIWNKSDQERTRSLKNSDYPDFNYFTGAADCAYNLMVAIGLEPIEEEPNVELAELELGENT